MGPSSGSNIQQLPAQARRMKASSPLPNRFTFLFHVEWISARQRQDPAALSTNCEDFEPRIPTNAPRVPSRIWRWTNHEVAEERDSGTLNRGVPDREQAFAVTTLFFGKPRGILLAIARDIRRRDDDPNRQDWQEVGFNWNELPASLNGKGFVFSEVHVPAEETRFAAPIESHWAQLFPEAYHRDPEEVDPEEVNAKNAGLTGDFSLIVGLIALRYGEQKFPDVIQRNLKSGHRAALPNVVMQPRKFYASSSHALLTAA